MLSRTRRERDAITLHGEGDTVSTKRDDNRTRHTQAMKQVMKYMAEQQGKSGSLLLRQGHAVQDTDTVLCQVWTACAVRPEGDPYLKLPRSVVFSSRYYEHLEAEERSEAYRLRDSICAENMKELIWDMRENHVLLLAYDSKGEQILRGEETRTINVWRSAFPTSTLVRGETFLGNLTLREIDWYGSPPLPLPSIAGVHSGATEEYHGPGMIEHM